MTPSMEKRLLSKKDNLCPTNALPSFASIYAVNKVDLLDPRKSFLLKIIPK